jgi:glucose-1-phosphate thymidylyltransferase
VKGIILAGGNGSRLHPLTLGTSKQLLPVYDKPLIYYPLSVLMLAGITDIQIITRPADVAGFRRLLGDGSALGLSLSYAVQEEPRGLAEAFLIGARHIGTDSVALVLGDNLFHGLGFSELLRGKSRQVDGCVLFGYPVHDPSRFGVGEADAEGRLISIEEKPSQPRSNLALTGLYLYDNDVVDVAKNIRPSDRGELEITDVNRVYLERGKAELVSLGRGFVWLDAGTPDTLVEAAQYVRVLENRQGIRIACIEEIAWRMGFIDREACRLLGERLAGSPYGRYILALTAEDVSACGSW